MNARNTVKDNFSTQLKLLVGRIVTVELTNRKIITGELNSASVGYVKIIDSATGIVFLVARRFIVAVSVNQSDSCINSGREDGGVGHG